MKNMRKTGLVLTALLVVLCTLLAACGGNAAEVQYEVANYQGALSEGQLKSDFNKELFYRNDKQTGLADPFVLDNTEVDGYYYMYGTEGSLFCYRSQNLMDWEAVGNALDNYFFNEDGTRSDVLKATWQDIWAPEVVYDPQEQMYYMFFSATPAEDTKVKSGNGVEAGTPTRQLMVAKSQYPYKNFEVVNFKDAKSCGAENLHDYSEKQFPHYFAKYLMLDPSEYIPFSKANGRTDAGVGYGGYTTAIDPHPYVDEDGTKYLLWVDNLDQDRLCGVKMENWLKPDWDTATVLTYTHYYTVQDWKAAQNGEYVDQVSYENQDNHTNEGPVLIKHNGKYYLTFSVNDYWDSSYQLGQAVSDNVLGPYRKLTEAEGGLLLSGGVAGSQEISGTGHHSFVTLGDNMYVIYHRHDSYTAAGTARNHAIDEIKWITVKDQNGSNMEVMYANGPTCTVQPRLEAYSDYRNIAPEASVTGTEDAEYLNDSLLSIYKYGDVSFMEYIKETMITETTTFTFDFENAKAVRAIMIYNSKNEHTCFRNVSKVEFICEEEGQEVIRCIENIQFSPEYYRASDYDDSIYYVTPGAAAYAEFKELNVKSVRITVEVPEGQESVGISEVRILGK